MAQQIPDRRSDRTVSTRVLLLALVLLGLGGLVACLMVTQHGVGVSPDSVRYLGAARNLSNGRGLTEAAGPAARSPMTHYPPLFPSLLALLGVLGVDPLPAAKWLNMALFAVNLVLVGYILFSSTRSAWAPILGSLLVLTSVDLLHAHTSVWSEPLFLFFCLTGFHLLERYLSDGSVRKLIGSAIMLGMSCLTRYTGAAVIGGAGLSIWLFDRRARSRRFSRCLLFAAVSCLPTCLWLMRNAGLTGGMTNRALAVHLIDREKITTGFDVASYWLFPRSFPAWADALGLTAITSAVLAAGILLAARKIRQGPHGLRPRRGTTPLIFILFILSYLGFVLTSICLFDANTPLDDRILAPVYVAGVIAALSLLHAASAGAARRPALTAVVVVACAAFAVRHLLSAHTWMVERGLDGAGYTSRAWKDSDLVDEVRRLPADAPVYTNDPYALGFLLGQRTSYRLPAIADPTTRRKNLRYSDDLLAMKDHLSRQGGFIAYVSGTETWYLPSEKELRRALPLREMITCNDGSIYALRQ